jgi:exodeoxyribonuclease VII large subunit
VESALGRAITERTADERIELDRRVQAVRQVATWRLERLNHEFARLAGETEGRSPLRVLARGYAVVTSPEGHVVRDPADAPAGAPLRVRLHGGTLRARSEGADPATPIEHG